MRRLALLALALAFVAGCGGEGRLSKSEYQNEIRDVGRTLAESIGGIDTSFSGGNLEQVEGEVERLQEALREAATELEDLTPPEDVEGAHDELVDGIRGFADELDELREAIDDGDLEAIREFESEFTQTESVRKIREASAELEQKGYTLE